MRTPTYVLLGMVLLTDAAAADTNLLPNGDFANAAMASGWTCASIFGSQDWTGDDAGALATSGSIELSASAFGDQNNWFQGLEVCNSTCFDVRPGAAYAYGGQSRVIAVAGAAGSSFAMHFACGVYAYGGCSGSPTWLPAPAMSMAPDWTAPAVTDDALPAGAVSAGCQLLAIADGENGSGTGHFDNLFFTTDVIFAADFENP
jgi:hypothetical protein